jgi:hypothetical protein
MTYVFLVILWAVIGMLVITQDEVTKLDYCACWAVMMAALIKLMLEAVA